MNYGTLVLYRERCGYYPDELFVDRSEVAECFGNKDEYVVFNNDANGIPFRYQASGNTFKLETEGSNRIRIDQTGNLSE